MDEGISGYPGGVKYRAPYGAKNTISAASIFLSEKPNILTVMLINGSFCILVKWR